MDAPWILSNVRTCPFNSILLFFLDLAMVSVCTLTLRTLAEFYFSCFFFALFLGVCLRVMTAFPSLALLPVRQS